MEEQEPLRLRSYLHPVLGGLSLGSRSRLPLLTNVVAS